mgnify:CR=1 FL=1
MNLKRGTLVKGRQTRRGTLPFQLNGLQEGTHGIILEQVFDPIGTNIYLGDLQVVEK